MNHTYVRVLITVLVIHDNQPTTVHAARTGIFHG